jgi:hypothetical protein
MLESDGAAAGLRALCSDPSGVDESVIGAVEKGSETERSCSSRGGPGVFWVSSARSCWDSLGGLSFGEGMVGEKVYTVGMEE